VIVSSRDWKLLRLGNIAVGRVASCEFRIEESFVPYLTPDHPLWREVASIASDEGLELYDLERSGGGSLRVFVDKPSKVENSGAGISGQVTSDDTTKLCRRLVVFFLAEGEGFGVGSEPSLEVSSPGVNRSLRLREHFVRSIGERVRVTFTGASALTAVENPVAGSVAVGMLQGVNGDVATILDESAKAPLSFELGQVKRANVDFKF
jgi:ribosome maturation factor RimP